MPKRSSQPPEQPALVQLPLFAEAATLVRAHPELAERRFYRCEVRPDLFGRAVLLRHWGRSGTAGACRLDPYPDPGAALNAMARLLQQKRRCGYTEPA